MSSNYRIPIGLPNNMRVTVRRDALVSTQETNLVMQGIKALKNLPKEDQPITGRIAHVFAPTKQNPFVLFDIATRRGEVLARGLKSSEWKELS